MTLRVGMRLHDARKNRTVELERRVNPVGLAVSAYWVVRNVESGRVTVIRENRFGKARWTEVEDDPTREVEVEVES